jgi:UPF0716 protein FxsA
MPILVVLLMFLAWPFLEIAAFIAVGEHIGILPTLALTILSSMAGGLLLRIQGLAVLDRARRELTDGRVPAQEIGHAALITLAGFLLLVPGFISDAIGLILFLPPVRSLILRAVARNMNIIVVSTSSSRRRTRTVVDLDPDEWHETDASSTPPPRQIGDHHPDLGR